METNLDIDIVSDVQPDVEPTKISNDDYIWYLTTERDIITYIFTYIDQCNALGIRYLQQFLSNNCRDMCKQSYKTLYMLENAIKYKLIRPGMSLDELYHSQEVEIYIRSVGRGSTDFRFHVPCVRDLIYFIDINQKTVSEFDFDRHQSLYNVIHEYNMYTEREKTRETILRKEQYEKERKLRIDTSAQEKTKSQHKPCIMS